MCRAANDAEPRACGKCWMTSELRFPTHQDFRLGPSNVPLSCWRGFAASPHRGDATGKAVPISFSGVLERARSGGRHRGLGSGDALRFYRGKSSMAGSVAITVNEGGVGRERTVLIRLALSATRA